ncbi:MAG: glycosyltransferase [Akkermansiaceae bacterium]
MPLVSVVLPFRDAETTLRDAVHSILKQEFDDFELIAVDDNSTDKSLKSLNEIKDQRLRIVSNQKREGVVGATATGLELATGTWFSRMDADDLAKPRKITEQLKVAGNDTGVITCGVEPIDSQGEGMNRYVDWVNQLADHEAISRSRFIESPVINPTAMVRMDWMKKVSGYHDTAWAEDHDLWLRLLAAGCRFGRVAETHFQWRDSKNRLTRQDLRYGTEARSRMRAHHLSKLAQIQENGVVIAGAGPIGKKLALDLKNEEVEVKGFFDVNPKRIGKRIQGIEVASAETMDSRWLGNIMLGAVGLEGARNTVREMALRADRTEGENFWSVC